jgi:hypothetical protein
MKARPTTLSAVWRQQPGLFDRAKISVVERFVSTIDQLPEAYSHIQVRTSQQSAGNDYRCRCQWRTKHSMHRACSAVL